jgi:hypothetical protein
VGGREGGREREQTKPSGLDTDSPLLRPSQHFFLSIQGDQLV